MLSSRILTCPRWTSWSWCRRSAGVTPPYRSRRVRIRATLSRSEAVYVIEDEGPGFDPATLPVHTDPANLERIGGRGLMLIRTFMDEVEHNEKGNRITLRKSYPTAECPRAPADAR